MLEPAFSGVHDQTDQMVLGMAGAATSFGKFGFIVGGIGAGVYTLWKNWNLLTVEIRYWLSDIWEAINAIPILNKLIQGLEKYIKFLVGPFAWLAKLL